MVDWLGSGNFALKTGNKSYKILRLILEQYIAW